MAPLWSNSRVGTLLDTSEPMTFVHLLSQMLMEIFGCPLTRLCFLISQGVLAKLTKPPHFNSRKQMTHLRSVAVYVLHSKHW